MGYWGAIVDSGRGERWGWYGGLEVFGSTNLTVTSPVQSFVEPITIGDACAFLRIATPTDPNQLNRLQYFIQAARVQAEISQGRDLVLKQWDLSLDYWLDYRIRLGSPLDSVQLVQYTDFQGNVNTLPQVEGTTALTGYMVDTAKQPGSIIPPYNATWPTFTPLPSSAVLIRFTTGYSASDPYWSDAGSLVKNGMLFLISEWWNNRLAFEVGGGAIEGDYKISRSLNQGQIMRAR